MMPFVKIFGIVGGWSFLPPRVDDAGASSSSASTSHICVPHTCITCKNIFLGPIGDLPKYHFLVGEDTPDTPVEGTNPDAREEGNASTWTPSVSVRVYIFLL